MDIFFYIYAIFILISFITVLKFLYIYYFYTFILKKWNKTEGEILLSEKIYYK
jgi:hypothetical protein